MQCAVDMASAKGRTSGACEDPPAGRTEREKSAWQADLAKVPDCSGDESRKAGGHGAERANEQFENLSLN